MKYETPELTALTPAINAIQSLNKGRINMVDTPTEHNENPPAYADWE